MLQMSADWLTDITAPSRIVDAKVDVYRNSALVYTFLPEDNLVSVNLSRATENGQLFGYTICQKATIEILNPNGSFAIEKGDVLNISIGTETELAKNPSFYVEEVKNDEVKKNITVVAYDGMNKSTKALQKDLGVTYPITTIGYANLIGAFLGVGVKATSLINNITYTEEAPPNFSGEETLREVLSDLAEITGTICYIDSEDDICFKQLGGTSVGEIDKELYFDLKMGKPVEITQISRANELGDTVSAGVEGGYHYIVRNNAFLEGNGTDIADMLFNLVNLFGGTVFYPYEIKWRGNPAFEIGDRITIEKNDDTTVDIYYFGETLAYNGGLLATSEWSPKEEEELEGPPTSIGEAINRTSAKVDKVNNEITLVAGTVDENATNISNLALTADDIKASVESVQSIVSEGFESMNDEMATLSQRVDLGVSAEDVKIAISSELANGVDKVTTSTGYTFNEEGLTVSKSTSDITTTITEDGMRVERGGETVLTANNEGVIAEDLHATTYLIIGNNSRFEDFINRDGEARTGCFWIGG